jgi:5-methyltetrahydrofolate--homocysteine methyltransferase
VKLPDLIRASATGYLVTDGAWGTELQKYGLRPGESADVWNVTHPGRVEAVARSYVDAGSQIILTNTFQANASSLAAHGWADRADEINAAGVAISKRAARDRAKVFGSLGPAEMYEAFRAQAESLARAGADALVVETMTNVDEARVAAAAAKSTGLAVVVSFVFMAGGVTPELAVEAMVSEGVDGIGANCGIAPEGFQTTCERLRVLCDLPIWMKPSAGLPEASGGVLRYRMNAADFGSVARGLAAAGASFIGGCCGTTPEFIRSI